jgi:hypothetical protein
LGSLGEGGANVLDHSDLASIHREPWRESSGR